ncbi:sensor histidine kinase [Paenibacillus solisilvae]|uniref:Sensor histidine kinase n=1 Tax=Paenibacillus solisilvae TaxID=2486751 RepID=A0ABW0W6A5_9BACL
MALSLQFLLRSLLCNSVIRTTLFSYLSLNLLLLFLLGYLTIRDSTAGITKEVTDSGYKVMEQAALGFGFNLEEAKRPLVQLAGNYSVISLMNPTLEIGYAQRIQHERNISDLAYGVSNFQSLISDILILGKNGYINNLDGRKSLKWDYRFSEQPWFKAAVDAKSNRGFITLGLHKQNYYLENIYSKYNQTALSIAIPVKDYYGKTIGAAIANLDLKKINRQFELSSYQNNESIFMVDDNQTIIVHKDEDSIGKRLDFSGIERIYRSDSGSFVSRFDGVEQLVIFHSTSEKGLHLISTVPMSVIRSQADPLRANLIGTLYLCLCLNALISIIITVRISRPIGKLLHTLDNMGEDSLYVISKNYKYSELNLIGEKFKELVGRTQLLVKQNFLSTIAMKEAELKSLQSQINPHFLFNTLQALQTEIVCGNTDDSNRLVLSLGGLLRYSMKQSAELVPLERELQNVKDYLFIMNIKYDNRIEVQYDIPNPAVLHYRTVKLTLQPIVENAIIHGFLENPEENARIRIRLLQVSKGAMVEVEDTGCGMSRESKRRLVERLRNPEASPESIGLSNVNQRIQLKFGSGYGIRIRSRPGLYTRIYVILPKSEGEGDAVSE